MSAFAKRQHISLQDQLGSDRLCNALISSYIIRSSLMPYTSGNIARNHRAALLRRREVQRNLPKKKTKSK